MQGRKRWRGGVGRGEVGRVMVGRVGRGYG